MNTITVKLNNIKCMGCASNIVQAAQEMDGISEVTTQVGSGEVTFTYLNDGIKENYLDLLAEKGYPLAATDHESKSFFKNIFKS